MDLSTLLWLVIAATVLHVVEETATGFLPFLRTVLTRWAGAITPGWAVSINAAQLGWMTLVAVAEGLPVWLRLSVAALLGVNALLHVGVSLARRRYTPGLVTAVALYLPLAAATVWAGIREAGPADVLAGLGMGLVLHGLVPVSLAVRTAIRVAPCQD